MSDISSDFKSDFYQMTPSQCRAARGLLGLEQNELAKVAGIARTTLIDLEKGQRTPRTTTVEAIRAALEAAGVEFIAPNGGGAGVRLRKP
jgi:DNA-binding XRE family transcriptional regulator